MSSIFGSAIRSARKGAVGPETTIATSISPFLRAVAAAWPASGDGGELVRRNAGFAEQQRRQHAHAGAFRADGGALAGDVLQFLERRPTAVEDPQRLVEHGADRAHAVGAEVGGKAGLHDADVGLLAS